MTGMFMFVLALPSLLAGYGLLREKNWGRILTIIVSFFNLLNFPLGTALERLRTVGAAAQERPPSTLSYPRPSNFTHIGAPHSDRKTAVYRKDTAVFVLLAG